VVPRAITALQASKEGKVLKEPPVQGTLPESQQLALVSCYPITDDMSMGLNAGCTYE
jgi:hypothetical protein